MSEQSEKPLTEDGYVIRPNKSALKREHQKIQEFAHELIRGPDTLLALYDLPDKVCQQVRAGRKLKGTALKRHIKHVANLIEHWGWQQVVEKREALELAEKQATRFNAIAEQWRDRFWEEGDAAFEPFVEAFPTADRQALRSLLRKMDKAEASGNNSTLKRKLFEQIRASVQQNQH
jgi:ribosome-associated protein